MNDRDRAIVAAAEERDREADMLGRGLARAVGAGIREARNRAVERMRRAAAFHAEGTPGDTGSYSAGYTAAMNRAAQIVEEEFGADDVAEQDRADAEAAERATAGKWGG